MFCFPLRSVFSVPVICLFVAFSSPVVELINSLFPHLVLCVCILFVLLIPFVLSKSMLRCCVIRFPECSG